MKNFNQRNRNDKRGFGGRDFGKRSMHKATCDECGQPCEVPFKPSGGKPIYCSNCFEKNKSSGYVRPDRRDSGKFSYGNNQMFAAVCAKCGKNCEVPFKPSGGKPIFCNECFSQNRGGSKNILPAKEQFEIINSKLDKILMALNPAVKEVAEIKPNKKASVLAPKKVAPKKAGNKKAAVSASGKPKKKKK